MAIVEEKQTVPRENIEEELLRQIAQYLVQEKLITPEEQIKFYKLLEMERQ